MRQGRAQTWEVYRKTRPRLVASGSGVPSRYGGSGAQRFVCGQLAAAQDARRNALSLGTLEHPRQRTAETLTQI
jgi:hypothetical protein